MRFYKNENQIDVNSYVKYIDRRLSKEKFFNLDTSDHAQHIAAYIAWKNVGGNLYINNPLFSTLEKAQLLEKAKQLNFTDSIIFSTSGTTNKPKLVVYTLKQLTFCQQLADKVWHWDSSTQYLNFLPAFTSGFWYQILPNIISNNVTVHFGSRETMLKDFDLKVNMTICVPGQIDLLSKIAPDLKFNKFKQIGSGSQQVLLRHTNYLFNNKLKEFVHAYGTTESGVPTLFKRSSHNDDNPTYLNLNEHSELKLKIVNNELLIKGDSLCKNYKEFETQDDYFCTGDLFEVDNHALIFEGRKNEVIKLNGFRANLLKIENAIEEYTNLGECIAVPRNTLSTDWLEIFYTNNVEIKKNEINRKLEKYLEKNSIPRKYTLIDKIPRNAMNKKDRKFIYKRNKN